VGGPQKADEGESEGLQDAQERRIREAGENKREKEADTAGQQASQERTEEVGRCFIVSKIMFYLLSNIHCKKV
jgi:hypothetical protein